MLEMHIELTSRYVVVFLTVATRQEKKCQLTVIQRQNISSDMEPQSQA